MSLRIDRVLSQAYRYGRHHDSLPPGSPERLVSFCAYLAYVQQFEDRDVRRAINYVYYNSPTLVEDRRRPR